MNMSIFKDMLLIFFSLFIFLIYVLEMSKLVPSYHLEKRSTRFFCKGQESKYFSFVGQVVSVATT